MYWALESCARTCSLTGRGWSSHSTKLFGSVRSTQMRTSQLGFWTITIQKHHCVGSSTGSIMSSSTISDYYILPWRSTLTIQWLSMKWSTPINPQSSTEGSDAGRSQNWTQMCMQSERGKQSGQQRRRTEVRKQWMETQGKYLTPIIACRPWLLLHLLTRHRDHLPRGRPILEIRNEPCLFVITVFLCCVLRHIAPVCLRKR